MRVRRIAADEGMRLKELRLRALREAPYAFTTTFAQAEQFPDSAWHERARAGAEGREQVVFIAEEPGGEGRSVWLGMVGGMVEQAAPERPRPHMASSSTPPGVPVTQDSAVSIVSLVSLISMWVDPDARRSGAGRALVEAVLDWARSRGASVVQLSVYRGNDAAARLYERCGFVYTGEEEASARDPGDVTLLMEGTL